MVVNETGNLDVVVGPTSWIDDDLARLRGVELDPKTRESKELSQGKSQIPILSGRRS